MSKLLLHKFDLKAQQFVQRVPLGPWIQKSPTRTVAAASASLILLALVFTLLQTEQPSPSIQPITQQAPNATSAQSILTGDLNGDGKVNSLDLSIMLHSWGKFGGPADLNKDGVVNSEDLSILLNNWTTN